MEHQIYDTRKKLIERGPAHLTDCELIEIVLGHGFRNKGVGEIAEEVNDALLTGRTDDLTNITGVGECKAAAIIAMQEMGRRWWSGTAKRIKTPADLYSEVRHHANCKQEVFLSISLNGAYELNAVRVVSLGLVNRTVVHPREVFAGPLEDGAAAVCVAHNHPSGELRASKEDDDVTLSLEAAAEVLGIRLVDHLIFSENSFFSYATAKKLLRGPRDTSGAGKPCLPLTHKYYFIPAGIFYFKPIRSGISFLFLYREFYVPAIW